MPHQCWRGSALKNDRREVPGSIPDSVSQPSRLEFSVAFFETRERIPKKTPPPVEIIPPIDPGLTSGQKDIKTYNYNHSHTLKMKD